MPEQGHMVFSRDHAPNTCGVVRREADPTPQGPRRWAFVKDDIPELQPRIMVVIVQHVRGTEGEVTDFKVCEDRAEAEAYMRVALSHPWAS